MTANISKRELNLKRKMFKKYIFFNKNLKFQKAFPIVSKKTQKKTHLKLVKPSTPANKKPNKMAIQRKRSSNSGITKCGTKKNQKKPIPTHN